MWQDLWSALALVMVIEGIMPFVSPDKYKDALRRIQGLNVKQLRIIGGASMVAGLLFLTMIRS